MLETKPRYEVHVHGNPNPLHQKGGIIRHIPAPVDAAGGVFALFDGEERLVASCSCPRSLSKYAFGQGADVVKHDYDLKLGEER